MGIKGSCVEILMIIVYQRFALTLCIIFRQEWQHIFDTRIQSLVKEVLATEEIEEMQFRILPPLRNNNIPII